MDSKYNKYLDYVEESLKNANKDKGKKHPFRSRFTHIKRVIKWVDILCADREDYDPDVLYISTIFHDIGYVIEHENHQIHSANLFKEYAVANNMEPVLTEKIVSCIGIHSDKELMETPDKLTIEQILLMEADLLDEEGALSICWHCMAAGYEGDEDYYECLNRLKQKYAKRINKQPMVTQKAKEIWDEKIIYMGEYINRLEIDLEM